ncbi:MAG: ankyrin repeat domain-containing protein [Pirellulales bacterium]|nr:ankyrin repeat domain-containing protein [Pirellulales bacterium]
MLEQVRTWFARRREQALAQAAEDGLLDRVRTLLAAGASPNARSRDGFTALMWAAARGHVDVVNALLQSGAQLDARTRNGRTAVDIALQEGRNDVAALLGARVS